MHYSHQGAHYPCKRTPQGCRGREQAHPQRGRDLLQRLFEDLEGLATIESKPLQEGRNMSMLLGPSKEALQEAAKDEPKAQPDADAIPDHPQAVVPDHPQAIPTTPEDLAEAAESAKSDVAAKSADDDAEADAEAEASEKS